MTTRSSEDRAREIAALHRVQRRVGAIAFFAIAIHGVIGLVVVAEVVHRQGRVDDAVLLLVMSGAFAVVTYAVVRLILAAPLWSPVWVVVAMLPTVAGFFWVL